MDLYFVYFGNKDTQFFYLQLTHIMIEYNIFDHFQNGHKLLQKKNNIK